MLTNVRQQEVPREGRGKSPSTNSHAFASTSTSTTTTTILFQCTYDYSPPQVHLNSPLRIVTPRPVHSLVAMVQIGDYAGFCICDLNEQATRQHYLKTSDESRDKMFHCCKTTLKCWVKATGMNKAQQAEFAKSCLEAYEMKMQTMEARKRVNVSVACISFER